MGIIKIYEKARAFLYKEPGYKIVHVISHGFLHIIVSFVLIILCVFLFSQTTNQAKTVFKELTLEFNDNNSGEFDYLNIVLSMADPKAENQVYENWLHIKALFECCSDTVISEKRKTDFGAGFDCGRGAVIQWPPQPPVKTKFFLNKMFILEVIGSENSALHKYPFTEEKSCHYFNKELGLSYLDVQEKDYIRLIKYTTATGLISPFAYEMNGAKMTIDDTISGNILGIKPFKKKSFWETLKFWNNDYVPYFNFILKLKSSHYRLKMVDSKFCGQYADDNFEDMIMFDFNPFCSKKELHDPIQITNIFPQPNLMIANMVAYKGKDKVQEVLDNGGVSFSGIAYNQKDMADRNVFLCTVLLGAALAFLLDVIVDLVIKWKNLSERMRNKGTNYQDLLSDDLK